MMQTDNCTKHLTRFTELPSFEVDFWALYLLAMACVLWTLYAMTEGIEPGVLDMVPSIGTTFATVHKYLKGA